MTRHHHLPFGLAVSLGIAAALTAVVLFCLGMAVYSYRRTGK